MGMGRDILYAVGAAASSPLWGASLLRTGKWRTDWAGRFGRTEERESERARDGNERTLLIHAVSVGEVNLIHSLVEELQISDPQLRIVISATTNTGFDRAAQLYGESHQVVRYPLDFSGAVRRFLDAIAPDAVALVELEVWPNFVEACNRRGIPVAVINGRLSERSFKRYRLARAMLRSTFARLAAVAAQTSNYAQRFTAMGVPADKVCVLDTMKWDAATLADDVDGSASLAAAMGIDRGRPIIVLGSTGNGEETLLVEALRQTCADSMQIFVVPRKPERFDEVAVALPGIVRRTQTGGFAAPAKRDNGLFLLDTLGELRQAYALADVVIVGRTFNGWGGSDPIEPVALGKPTIVGPDHHNFSEVIAALAQGEGVMLANDPIQAAQQARTLLSDPARAAALAKAGREVILSRQGSTRRHAQLLRKVLESSATSLGAS